MKKNIILAATFVIFLSLVARRSSAVPEDLETRVFAIKHAEVKAITEVMEHLKSPDGKISSYDPTQAIIAVDYPENLNRMAETIKLLDVKAKEVMIDVLVAEVSREFLSAIGVSFGQNVIPKDTFDAVLYFFDENKKVNTRSKMSVRTLSGRSARLNVSRKEIFGGSVFTAGRVAVIFPPTDRSAGSFLEATPIVNRDSTITISIRPEKSTFNSDGSIEESSILTEVIVKSGDTIALGGLSETREEVNFSEKDRRVMMFLTATVAE